MITFSEAQKTVACRKGTRSGRAFRRTQRMGGGRELFVWPHLGCLEPSNQGIEEECSTESFVALAGLPTLISNP
jgi:hypothetical protein